MTKNNSLRKVTFFITLITYLVLHGEGRQIKSLAKIVDTTAQKDSCPGAKCLHNFQTTTLSHSPVTGRSYLTPNRKGVKSEINIKTAKIEKRFLSNLPTPINIFSDSKVIYDNNFRPTPPGRSPGAGHPEILDTETKQHNLDENCKDGTRSLTPGERTESGHCSISKTETTNQGNTFQTAHTHAGQKDDYPPTAPGHSPGAGHPQTAHLHAEDKDDYPPTTSGHNPGAGHPHAAHPQAMGKNDYAPTTPGRSPGAGHPRAEHPQAIGKDDYPPTTPGHSPGAGHAFLNNQKPS